jgi:hypothetical protein
MKYNINGRINKINVRHCTKGKIAVVLLSKESVMKRKGTRGDY